MLARFLQILAVQRTIDGIFALRPAADGANFAMHARTIASRASFRANLAGNTHRRLPLSYHRSMPRTDVYIKVELDLPQTEKPERVATEICRVIRKVYGVRSAEVSSMVDKES